MDRSKVRVFDQQAANDKEAKRLVRIAHKTGGTVSYDLAYLIKLKLSLKVIRAVYRG